MKRLFIAMLLILATLCATACAEQELYPFHALDMNTYGEGPSTVFAQIHPEQIDEVDCLVYEVYDTDLYKTEDVLALKPGDIICVNNDVMTVKKIEDDGSEIKINGGFFCEEDQEEQGATLVRDENDPTICKAEEYEDFSMTMIGQAGFQLNNPVTVTSFRWGEDGNWNGEYDVAEVAPAEFAEYMKKLKENDVFADAGNTTLTLENGKITEIRIEWHP